MKRSFFIFILSLLFNSGCYAYKIGLLIVATGSYIDFVEPLINSADTYFCNNHEVTYFIFTDSEITQAERVIKIYESKRGWPYDTLMRITMYHTHRDKLGEMDYLFATDADMLFVDEVGNEILSDRVATQHPGYVERRGTYERRPSSTAYVHTQEGTHYFAGGFNGGSAHEFLKMAKTITKNIMKDLGRNIIAVWHDESHINRYFIDNPPTQVLSPSYCYSMNLAATHGKRLPYNPRLIALDKDHAQLRK